MSKLNRSKIFCDSFVRRISLVLVISTLATTFSGCAEVGKEAVKQIIVAATVVTVVAITVTHVQEARAASLDVEKKQLEIDAIRNGQQVIERITLTESEVDAIRKTEKVRVKLDNGTETELSVGFQAIPPVMGVQQRGAQRGVAEDPF